MAAYLVPTVWCDKCGTRAEAAAETNVTDLRRRLKGEGWRRARIGIETGVVRPFDTGVYIRGGTYHRYASVERMVGDGWRAE